MDTGMMGFGLVWVLVLLAGLVTLVIWIVRRLFPQDGASLSAQEQDECEESALEIARRRYARGEITAEEFARLERDLA
jgi:uncharacterized membrane protein